MVKTLIDLLEESKLIEAREDKIFLGGAPVVKDNGGMQTGTTERTNTDFTSNTGNTGKNQNLNSGNIDAWAEQLLTKFPQFDPAWSDDVKLKWFDAFDRLMKGRGM